MHAYTFAQIIKHEIHAVAILAKYYNVYKALYHGCVYFYLKEFLKVYYSWFD